MDRVNHPAADAAPAPTGPSRFEPRWRRAPGRDPEPKSQAQGPVGRQDPGLSQSGRRGSRARRRLLPLIASWRPLRARRENGQETGQGAPGYWDRRPVGRAQPRLRGHRGQICIRLEAPSSGSVFALGLPHARRGPLPGLPRLETHPAYTPTKHRKPEGGGNEQ